MGLEENNELTPEELVEAASGSHQSTTTPSQTVTTATNTSTDANDKPLKSERAAELLATLPTTALRRENRLPSSTPGAFRSGNNVDDDDEVTRGDETTRRDDDTKLMLEAELVTESSIKPKEVVKGEILESQRHKIPRMWWVIMGLLALVTVLSVGVSVGMVLKARGEDDSDDSNTLPRKPSGKGSQTNRLPFEGEGYDQISSHVVIIGVEVPEHCEEPQLRISLDCGNESTELWVHQENQEFEAEDERSHYDSFDLDVLFERVLFVCGKHNTTSDVPTVNVVASDLYCNDDGEERRLSADRYFMFMALASICTKQQSDDKSIATLEFAHTCPDGTTLLFVDEFDPAVRRTKPISFCYGSVFCDGDCEEMEMAMQDDNKRMCYEDSFDSDSALLSFEEDLEQDIGNFLDSLRYDWIDNLVAESHEETAGLPPGASPP